MLTVMYDVDESIMCCSCDAGMECRSLEDAIHKGWTELEYDDGPSWNYLGLCPNCKRENEKYEQEQELRYLAKQRHLHECGWRPVWIEYEYYWVDPRGGDIIDFAHADLIQEHRDGKFSDDLMEQDKTVSEIKRRMCYKAKESAN